MDLLPRSTGEFASASYWERFFKKRGQKAFEWYGEYTDLCGILHKYMKPADKVLHIGCGNSTLGADLYDLGYKHVINIDISTTVVKNMKAQHEKKRPDLQFLQMDMCEMSFADGEFHAVLDKGTLDAVFTDSDDVTISTVDRMFAEISRVLRVGGRYVCVSLAQEHILDKVLEYFPQNGWMTRICYVAQSDKNSEQDFHMPVFAYVFTKFKILPNMPSILEIAPFEDKTERISSIEELKSAVKKLQDYGMIRQQLNKGTSSMEEHISLDLFSADKPQPRYKLYIVDSPSPKKQKFAIFIVPLGRDYDWLIYDKEGRNQLCEQAGFQRLLVVILNRTHDYANMDEVKGELSSKVMELAPEKVNEKQVPFLSLGESLDMRTIQHECQSQLSGPMVVEDVLTDEQILYRRLILLNQPQFVCGEVVLIKAPKSKKKKKGAAKMVIDDRLTCDHHMTMLAGFSLVQGVSTILENALDVLMLGLGAGVFPAYIYKHFEKAQIEIVDQDARLQEVAISWFDFPNQDPRLQVNIAEPSSYIKQLADKGRKYHVVIVDTFNTVTSENVIIPPPMLMESPIVHLLKNLLQPNGVLVINCLTKDSSKSDLDCFVKTLKSAFAEVFSKQLSSPKHHVLFASNTIITSDTIDKTTSEVKLPEELQEQINSVQKYISSDGDKTEIDIANSLKGLALR